MLVDSGGGPTHYPQTCDSDYVSHFPHSYVGTHVWGTIGPMVALGLDRFIDAEYYFNMATQPNIG